MRPTFDDSSVLGSHLPQSCLPVWHQASRMTCAGSAVRLTRCICADMTWTLRGPQHPGLASLLQSVSTSLTCGLQQLAVAGRRHRQLLTQQVRRRFRCAFRQPQQRQMCQVRELPFSRLRQAARLPRQLHCAVRTANGAAVAVDAESCCFAVQQPERGVLRSCPSGLPGYEVLRHPVMQAAPPGDAVVLASAQPLSHAAGWLTALSPGQLDKTACRCNAKG